MKTKTESEKEDRKKIEEFIRDIKDTKIYLESFYAEEEDIQEVEELIDSAQNYKEELDDIYKDADKIEDIKKRNLFLKENEGKIDKLKDNIEDIFRLTKSLTETKVYYLINKEELKSKTPEEFIEQMKLEFRFVKVINEAAKVFEKLDEIYNNNVYNKLQEFDKMQEELLEYNNELWEVETKLFGGPPDVHTEEVWREKEDILLNKLVVGSKEGTKAIIERLTGGNSSMPENWGSKVNTIPVEKMQVMLDRAESLNDDIIALESLRALEMLQGDKEKDSLYGRKILDKKRCIQELSHWKEDLHVDKYREEKMDRMQNIESREYEDALSEDVGNLSRVNSDVTINVEEDTKREVGDLSRTSSDDTLKVDDEDNMSIESSSESVYKDAYGETKSKKYDYVKERIQQMSNVIKKSKKILDYGSSEAFNVERKKTSLSTKLKLFAKRLNGENINRIRDIIGKISLRKMNVQKKFVPKFMDIISKNIKKNITRDI